MLNTLILNAINRGMLTALASSFTMVLVCLPVIETEALGNLTFVW